MDDLVAKLERFIQWKCERRIEQEEGLRRANFLGTSAQFQRCPQCRLIVPRAPAGFWKCSYPECGWLAEMDQDGEFVSY